MENSPSGNATETAEDPETFWRNQSALAQQRLLDPALYQVAFAEMKRQAIRVPVYYQKSLEALLEEAHDARSPRLLGEVLQELPIQKLDFSIEATGFSVAEIDLRIEGLSGPPPDAPDPADEPPPLAAGPVTKSGDSWQLGRHRLLCGSALERGSYQALM